MAGEVPDWVQMEAFYDDYLSCLGAKWIGWCPAWWGENHPSISNPAESANPGLLAVGALDYYHSSGGYISRNSLEDFSSRGPTTDGRMKPDVVAYDRITLDGRDRPPENFEGTRQSTEYVGTSFSSPAVAGVAALVWDRAASDASFEGGSIDTPAEVANYIKRQTADVVEFGTEHPDGTREGDADGWTEGPDNSSGFGRVQLPDPRPDEPPTVSLRLGADTITEHFYYNSQQDYSGVIWGVWAVLDKPASQNITVSVPAVPDQTTPAKRVVDTGGGFVENLLIPAGHYTNYHTFGSWIDIVPNDDVRHPRRAGRCTDARHSP